MRVKRPKIELLDLQKNFQEAEELLSRLNDDELPGLYKKNPQEAKLLARAAYFLYTPQRSIADRYGIPISTLRSWVYNPNDALLEPSWRVYREKMFGSTFQDILEGKVSDMTRITGLALTALERGLHALVANADKLSPADLQKLSGIIKDMKNEVRLDTGEATERVEVFDTSPEGIRALVKKMPTIDPYVDYELLDEQPAESDEDVH